MRFAFVFAALIVAPTLSVAADPSFQNEVMAVLSRAGCNAGACHGNLNGKGGLKLSLRGESPAVDHDTLTQELKGRRVNRVQPEASLLLRKATGATPHQGGVRFSEESSDYKVIVDWILAGAKFDTSPPKPVSLSVSPQQAVVFAPKDRVQLSATVTWPDGRTESINWLATFEQTTVGVAGLSRSGEVTRENFGETVVIVRYLNLMVPVPIAFVPDRKPADFKHFEVFNAIDTHAKKPWTAQHITPSPASSDAMFLRRVYLDTLGILPTVSEVKNFLADKSPNKRSLLIDQLLERPEYAQFWAQKWSDLLRNEEKALDKKGVQVFHRWIKANVAEDRPLTEFTEAVLTGRGNTYTSPPANFYRAIRDPYQRAESVAQVFLGLRISCARCHNHPFDRWTQDDYHRFAGNFARIGYRITQNDRRDDLDKHEFVGEQIVTTLPSGELPHPQGGNALPKLLGAEAVPADVDRLGVLAAWVTSAKNPFFAQAQVNRIWLHLMGRGLVDPNDDFRSTNPPSNPDLLQALIGEFTKQGYRAKPLIRLILNSSTYQLSSALPADGSRDERHFSYAMSKPLQAEQLLDAISATLDVPVKYPGQPLGVRAGELAAAPQAGRRADNGAGMRFLKVFGKPDRLLTCECERSEDPGMLQAFQLMTGGLLNDLLESNENRISQNVAKKQQPEDLLTELYLASLSRYPSDSERASLLKLVESSANQRATWEDITWSLLNSKEFQLRR